MHAVLQHIWRCQLVHIRRPRNTFLLCMHASSVCTRVAIRMQSSKESFAVNRLILAQEQLIHFVMVHSLLLPDKQRTPRFPDQSHITCHSRQNLQMLLNFQNLLPADLSHCYIHKALKRNHYFSSSTDDWPVSCTKSRIHHTVSMERALRAGFPSFVWVQGAVCWLWAWTLPLLLFTVPSTSALTMQHWSLLVYLETAACISSL